MTFLRNGLLSGCFCWDVAAASQGAAQGPPQRSAFPSGFSRRFNSETHSTFPSSQEGESAKCLAKFLKVNYFFPGAGLQQCSPAFSYQAWSSASPLDTLSLTNCKGRGPHHYYLRFTFWNGNVQYDLGCFDLSHCLVSGLQEIKSGSWQPLGGISPEAVSASFLGRPRHPVAFWSPGNTGCRLHFWAF